MCVAETCVLAYGQFVGNCIDVYPLSELGQNKQTIKNVAKMFGKTSYYVL